MSNFTTEPRLVDFYGDPKRFRNPTAKELKESHFLQGVVVECTRQELRQKDFEWDGRPIVAVNLSQQPLEHYFGLGAGKDIGIYNQMAKRFGWRRRAIVLVVDHMRAAETVAEGSAKLVRKIMGHGDVKHKSPRFDYHLMDWEGRGGVLSGVYTRADIDLPAVAIEAKEFASMSPEQFLLKRLADTETVIAKIRRGLNGKRVIKRTQKPRLRLVGKAVA